MRRDESRLRRYLLGSLRVATLLLVGAAVLLYIDYRSARAAVFERLLGIGQRMAPYLDDVHSTERPREIRINGARFFVAAGKTDHPPEMVRKFYRDRYAGRDGGFGALAEELQKRHALPPGMPNVKSFEFGDAKTGGVASLDFGGEKHGLAELVRRLKTVVETGDLGNLARLRYAYTERTDAGGTRFLTIWTDEAFNLNQLVAKGGRGDAPGFDVENVPRFPGTYRVMSMEENAMPQRLAVYDGPGSPETAKLFFRARMRTMGWLEEPTFAQIAANQSKVGLHFTRAGHEVFLALSDGNNGQGLNVVVMQTH